MTKQELRSSILKIRDGLPLAKKDEYDRTIHDRVMSYINEHDIRCVLTYVSFRSEVDTQGIIRSCLDQDIMVAVPKVYGEEIRFHYISSINELVSGYMGIKEPGSDLREWISEAEDLAQTIILVPGSVFDINNNRIGYGKGYYDRFISKNSDLYSAGMAYSFQITERIPTDDWDRPLDMVFNDIVI